LETLEVLKQYDGKQLTNYPKISYSNLYKKAFNNFYYEFVINEDKFLFSPLYTPLQDEVLPEFLDFVDANESFLNSLKEFLFSSLFVYSALVEENSYYLTNPQSILIARMIHKTGAKFEVKFYAHYEDELPNNYKDKIYIGRDFINLEKFDRKYLGLKKYFLSLIEQNQKIQERAKQKLRYYEEYKKPYLNEIEYLVNETATESMERMKLFPQTTIKEITRAKLFEILDHILYMQNLMVELRDFTVEFENKLRQRDEANFVKYLTKFSKDLIDGMRYLRKLSCLMHLRVANYAVV
jgi:hypothetical protein